MTEAVFRRMLANRWWIIVGTLLFGSLAVMSVCGRLVVSTEGDDGKVFVGARIDNRAEAWQMPQGGVDKGEDPRDAALRELWEETGVTSDLVEIIAETKAWLEQRATDQQAYAMYLEKWGDWENPWENKAVAPE